MAITQGSPTGCWVKPLSSCPRSTAVLTGIHSDGTGTRGRLGEGTEWAKDNLHLTTGTCQGKRHF